ncbi:hypothetical protein KIN20_010126 [Parelaphostrongylus tenuis]|uniref:Uncharacterized protein n=1 Tax=Parelaphostrongylus tenuis TaxID=148309 RepID=A0AAD5QIM6_PARTN|nr:hypothetical protein KIN20_010126 [Parelaphostrongylus tenuis]
MSLVCEIDPANAFVLQGTSRHCATCDSIWQKLSSHGLCPFQSLPGSFDTLFSNNIEEYCNKSFVPCLFTAGFSCIMVFFESDTIVAGCIRDIGSKFVKFQQSAHNPKVQEVVDIGHIYIGNPCSARSDNCAPSEVIHENRSMILPTCCCKGHRCTSPYAYRPALINSTFIVKDLPFSGRYQLYILAVCYATTFFAITVNACMTVYNSYCNNVIVKNQ